MTKYKKRTDNIDLDYQYYLGQEGLYHALYGDKLTKQQRQKRDYIWKQLLKEYENLQSYEFNCSRCGNKVKVTTLGFQPKSDRDKLCSRCSRILEQEDEVW